MSRVESQERRVKSQRARFVLRSFSGSRPLTLDSRLSRTSQATRPNSSGSRLSTLDPRLSFGITLIELLITMLIISILAGLILGVASVAGETAREAHTRNMVARLHTLLMQHYDTYKTRRVRLTPALEAEIDSRFAGNATVRGRVLAEARLYALREMMVMEIPDRWSDVLLTDVGNAPLAPLYLAVRPELANFYLRRYVALTSRKNDLTGKTNTAEELIRNQGAECLYMVITLATGDGEARTLFHEGDIGDSDGDGAPEFVDGWGRPINFLRWAPGFDSQIQLNAVRLAGLSISERDAAISGDHDPFDLFRVEKNAYRLVPLIYSPGADEDSGLNAATEYVTWRKKGQPSVNNGAPFVTPPLTPFELKPVNDLDAYLGTDLGEGTSTDNIHNHLLGQR